jgi:hypothetical protein
VATYLELIERAIAPLLARGFTLVRALEVPKNFGNAQIQLASDVFKLRIMSDRGQTFMDVGASDSHDWYDLSDVLTAAGQRSVAGPWNDAAAAVAAFQQHEAVIGQVLTDNARRSRLRARP